MPSLHRLVLYHNQDTPPEYCCLLIFCRLMANIRASRAAGVNPGSLLAAANCHAKKLMIVLSLQN